MQVILLERIGNLGQMGDIVTVRNGYARNYLLPEKKALRATKDNIAYFKSKRHQLEAENLEQKKDAQAVCDKLDGVLFISIRQAGDSSQLYGSVTTRNISEIVTEGGFTISPNQVILDRPIKTLGIHNVTIALHPEVSAEIKVNVARTQSEAERQLNKKSGQQAKDPSTLDETPTSQEGEDRKKEVPVKKENKGE